MRFFVFTSKIDSLFFSAQTNQFDFYTNKDKRIQVDSIQLLKHGNGKSDSLHAYSLQKREIEASFASTSTIDSLLYPAQTNQFVLVHRSVLFEMNCTSRNLTEKEINGRRQLVLDLVHLPTQELFDRSISHLQLFVWLPDELIAEVTQAFETTQANRKSNTTINDATRGSTEQTSKVANPYLKKPEVQDNPFTSCT